MLKITCLNRDLILKLYLYHKNYNNLNLFKNKWFVEMIVEHVCLSGQGGKILNCARRDTGRTREGDPQRGKCVVRVKCRCCSFLLLIGESAPLYLLLSLFSFSSHLQVLHEHCPECQLCMGINTCAG